MSDASSLVVKILGKDFRVACPDSEREALIASAEYLDGKMREIRDVGKVVGAERIAIMAALNIAHELLQKPEAHDDYSDVVAGRINKLQQKIDSALSETE